MSHSPRLPRALTWGNSVIADAATSSRLLRNEESLKQRTHHSGTDDRRRMSHNSSRLLFSRTVRLFYSDFPDLRDAYVLLLYRMDKFMFE
jgi:hypothetical protein